MIAVHITSSVPGQLHCTIAMDGPLQKGVTTPAPGRVLLTGKAAAHVAGAGHPGSEKPVTFSDQPGEGMYFASILEARVQGGKIETKPDHLQVTGATALTILVTAATGYRGFEFPPDTPLEAVIAKAQSLLNPVAGKTFEELHARQSSDHQRLFRRVSLRLGPSNPILKNPPISASKKLAIPSTRRSRPSISSTAATS